MKHFPLLPRPRLLLLFAALLGLFLFVLFGGVTTSIYLGRFLPGPAASLVVGALFLAALFALYIPGLLFHWTGAFEFTEFGAKPTGVLGYVIAALFWAGVAFLIARAISRKRKAGNSGHAPPPAPHDPI